MGTEVLLMIATLVALGLAVGMSVVAWKLLRDDRRRGDARVATLEAFAAADPPREPAEPSARFAALDDFAPRREAPQVLPAPAMFVASHERGAPGRRWATVAVVAIVMAGGLAVAYGLHSTRQRDRAGTATASTAPIAPAAARPPMALLSLKHDVGRDGTFTVIGLVQNPADGQPLQRVEAVVYLFDDQGNYFAMGRAPLDFTQLRPGEESPFEIRMPNVSHVARYRVGFRMADGEAVSHVDRRGQALGGLTSESGS